MLSIFKNKIDKLIGENAKLEILITKIDNKKNEINSTLETKLKKLENKAYCNKVVAERKIAELKSQIAKNKELIKTERKFYVGGINE